MCWKCYIFDCFDYCVPATNDYNKSIPHTHQHTHFTWRYAGTLLVLLLRETARVTITAQASLSCDHCDYIAKNRRGLKIHVNKKHGAAKNNIDAHATDSRGMVEPDDWWGGVP